MSLTYTQWVTSIGNIAQIPTTDPNFLTMLPNAIDDAEQRLYRQLDLLNTITRDSSASLTAGSRTFNLPASIGTFYVTEDINVITPSSQSNPDLGTRNSLMPASKEYLDLTWNSVNGSTVPQYFAMITQNQIIVGPWPDQSYQVEVVGTIRPQPLSSTNVTTLLSWYFPDVFVAASMVFVAGYMKNYGAGPGLDDPRQGVSWETHLQELLKSAEVEEQRKKFAGPGWSPKEPAPIATPPRT
jgi:hypothetical protein